MIKDPASIRGKIAVVKLDPDSWYCFHYMYEVRKIFSRWSDIVGSQISSSQIAR